MMGTEFTLAYTKITIIIIIIINARACGFSGAGSRCPS